MCEKVPTMYCMCCLEIIHFQEISSAKDHLESVLKAARKAPQTLDDWLNRVKEQNRKAKNIYV